MGLVVLCLKIFAVRIIDVSLGTIRTIFSVKGKTVIASFIGFFEIFVWFMIVREALNTDNTSIFVAISYALGFATGTYLGGILSDHFIKGNLSVQVIIDETRKAMIDKIREVGYAVSVMPITGREIDQKKLMLFINIDKNSAEELQNLIHKLDPKAFVVVNETKYVQNGFVK